MKDILGFDIAIGSFVAYACRSGSYTYLTVAEVRTIDTEHGRLTVLPIRDSLFGDTPDVRLTPLTVDQCVVVRNAALYARPQYAPITAFTVPNEEGHHLL